MNVKIPEEWYEILVKASKQKKVNFSRFIDYVMKTDECLNLPEISVSGKTKIVNIPYQKDEKEILNKIRKFLFCK